MEFRILGPLEVTVGDRPVAFGGRRQRALMTVLLLHANQVVPRDQLIEDLWSRVPPPAAARSLQVYISRLRTSLGAAADRLTHRSGGYVLRVEPGELDADRFEALLDQGRRSLRENDAARAAAALADALTLWRGRPLVEFGYEPFAQREVARLEELRVVALEERIEADLALGRGADLVAEVEGLVAEHPMRERLRGQLMLALYRCGRQADALNSYLEARSILVDEVGVEPGPKLRALHQAILQQDRSLQARTVTELPSELDPAGAPALAGRETELDRLREQWKRARSGASALVALVGEQGIGKRRLLAELAVEVQRDGGTVLYAHDGDIAQRQARAATPPALLVVEGPGMRAPGLLVVATAPDPDGLGDLRVDATLRLAPLGEDAVHAIAASYGGEDVPVAWLRQASGGVPERVHELASQWARRDAAQHIGAAAARAATGRVELRSVESEIAGRVVDLESARTRTRASEDQPVVCPYKGLAAFEADDAPYFFGRERLVAELVARLVGAPLLAIVGPSGSGKSSVLRAGLLPALAAGVLPGSEGWQQALIRPGEHPARELIAADGRRLLAVDQFEETFTRCDDEVERAAFVAELVRLADDERAVVVVAIRADHYGRCSTYPGLPDLLASNHVLVGPMRATELQLAVERPAQRAGLHVEPALSDALVADVEGEPGALPMLSAALLELWQHRGGRRLRHADYARTGGVRGAVARLAEEAFSQLAPDEQAIARGVLLRLTGEGPGGEVERRPIPLTDLEPEHTTVLRGLTDRRLLTVDGERVELAHEALLREWPRLRQWLDDDADGRRLHRHLTDAVRDWDQQARDPADLYRGARLASALEWRAGHEPDLNERERAFLDASRAAEHDELAAARRRTRRLRGLAVGLAALGVVAVTAAVLAVRQTQRAEDERRVALSRGLATLAVAQLEQDLDVAALLGLEALRADPTFEARSAILTVLPHLERAAGTLDGHTGSVSNVVFSPDGSTLVSTGWDGTVRLWDPRTRRQRGPTLTGSAASASRLAVSGDGSTLALATTTGSVRLWNLRSWRPLGQPWSADALGIVDVKLNRDGSTMTTLGEGGIRHWDTQTQRPLGPPLTGGEEGFTAMHLAADGSINATVGPDGTVRLWSPSARTERSRPFMAEAFPALGVAFAEDGRLLARGDEDGTVHLWDTARRREVWRTPSGVGEAVSAVAFDRAGATLAAAGRGGTIRLWDVKTRRPLGQPLRAHRGLLSSLAFSPDGTWLASAAGGGSVRLWRVRPPRPLGVSVGGGGGFVSDIAADPRGKVLAIARSTGAIELWDVASRRRLDPSLAGHRSGVTDLAFGAGGTMLASGTADGTIRLWDVGAHRQLGPPLSGAPAGVSGIAFGAMLAAAGDTIRLWDPTAPRAPIRLLTGRRGVVRSVAFAEDGTTLAAGGDDGAVQLWNAVTRRRLGPPLTGHTGPVMSLAFAPGGEALASAGLDGTVRLWDVPRRRPLGPPLSGGTEIATGVAFSDDGRTLASSGGDGALRLWDVPAQRAIGAPISIRLGPPASAEFVRGFLATASDDSAVLWDPILWSGDPRALTDRVCDAVDRDLSRAQWAQFVPNEPYHRTCDRP